VTNYDFWSLSRKQYKTIQAGKLGYSESLAPRMPTKKTEIQTHVRRRNTLTADAITKHLQRLTESPSLKVRITEVWDSSGYSANIDSRSGGNFP